MNQRISIFRSFKQSGFAVVKRVWVILLASVFSVSVHAQVDVITEANSRNATSSNTTNIADSRAEDDRATIEKAKRVEVIETDIERRNVKFKRIDSENFEVTLSAGILAIEDFDTGEIYSLRLGYHMSEKLFAEASYSISKSGRTTAEEFLPGNVTILRESDRDYESVDISLGINVFPGETWFFGRAYSSDLYTILGIGRTEFARDDWTTLNVGVGYRFFVNDLIALRLDIRDHIFTRKTVGDDRTNNIEMALGISAFF